MALLLAVGLAGCSGSNRHSDVTGASPAPATTAVTASVTPSPSSSSSSSATATPAAQTCSPIPAPSPKPRHLVLQCQLGAGPEDIMVAHGSIWVADHEAATIDRLDSASLLAQRFETGKQPGELASGDGSIWSTNYDGTITRINLRTGQSSSLGSFKHLCGQSVVTRDAIWVNVCDVGHPYVARVSLLSGQVTATVPVGSAMAAMTIADGNLIVASYFPGKLILVDPETGQVQASEGVPGCPLFGRTSFGFGSLWVSTAGGCGETPQDTMILQVDPATGRILSRLRPPGLGSPLDTTTVGDGAVWFADESGAIDRYDPGTGRFTPWSMLHSTGVYTVEAAAGALWGISFDKQLVYRLSVK